VVKIKAHAILKKELQRKRRMHTLIVSNLPTGSFQNVRRRCGRVVNVRKSMGSFGKKKKHKKTEEIRKEKQWKEEGGGWWGA
jgi:hypothetical protein